MNWHEFFKWFLRTWVFIVVGVGMGFTFIVFIEWGLPKGIFEQVSPWKVARLLFLLSLIFGFVGGVEE